MLLQSEAVVDSARPVRSAKGLSKTQIVKSETAWLISKRSRTGDGEDKGKTS